MLLAAKLAAEIAERLHFPTVVGEIVAGIAIGPSVLDLVGGDATLRVLGEIGVILLLLEVGLQMNLAGMGSVGRASLSVAAIGVVVPLFAGAGVALGFGHDGDVALYLGAALCATSVGITARVFSDLRVLGRPEARTVLGAAVADDVLGLVILTVVVRLVSEGSVSALSVVGIVALAVGFLVVAAVVGTRLAPPLFSLVHRRARSAGTLVALALAFALAFAELADAAKLAPIVGAFVAGLALSGSDQSDRIRRELSPVGHLFIPVFFLQIGIDAEIGAFARPAVLGIAGALLAVGVAGKLVAALGATGSAGDRWLIGLGMLPRGEVGLIFATIGLREGVLTENLYASLLLVVLATTLAAPPLLRARLLRLRKRRAGHPSTAAMPAGGWLVERDGEVDLAAHPPDHLALHLGLEAALAVADARPGPRLLDWLGGLDDDAPLNWDDDATRALFDVLTSGNPRSWRFLETTGVLERALPELAEAVQRRRADPIVVEPSHVLHFSLVEAIREVGTEDEAASEALARLEHPEWLLLAALILDTAGDDASPVDLARRLVKRLDLGAAAEQEIALLVGDSALLRAAAARVDGLGQETVLQLATHLDRPERVRALSLLSLALGELDPWQRQRLDELVDRVLAVLDEPELTGLDARNLVERRKAEAARLVGGASWTAERIEHAPRGYVLTQHAPEIARHAALLEPLPPRGRARVGTVAEGPHEWRVEVASRDVPGLLATVSGVLAAHGLDVLEAVVATWPDGGALESFRVRATAAPDRAVLEDAVVAALGRPLASPPDPGAHVHFDDEGSPWYTRCEVRSRDRRGLLHSITAGIASAGASVHSARVLTENHLAVDRFELTDRRGNKLGDATKDAIRRAITGGVTGATGGRLGRLASGRWLSGRRQRRDATRSCSGTAGETRPS
ncbi:MAG: cation:proton antiporter domain-containing protein [Actinomycetota bacterium]